MTGFRDEATGDTGFGEVPPGPPLPAAFVSLPQDGTIIANLSKNALLAGWRPGMLISDREGRLQPGTRISRISSDGGAITLSQTAIGSPVTDDLLTVQGGTKANPLWAIGNFNGNLAPGVARAVKMFNGRLWAAIDNAAVFSDSGDPLQRTFANQALTLENGEPITAMATMPFNTLTGGITQSLLLFQGDSGIWQITGDLALQNLGLNFLSPLGTLAPNSLATLPGGLFFVAPDGVRLVDQQGTVSEPIGANGDGVALPFVNTIYPSRIAAAYNEDVYRISCTAQQTAAGAPVQGTVTAEYWFHAKLKAWSGPHTFASALIVPVSREYQDHGYYSAPNSLTPGETGIWFSTTRPISGSSYIENGQPLYWLYQTSLLPDLADMRQNSILQATVAISLPLGTHADVDMVDEAGNMIDHAPIAGLPKSEWGSMVWGDGTWASGSPPPAPWSKLKWGAGRWSGSPLVPPGLWGQMVWGQNVWGNPGGGGIFAQRSINWNMPLVFKQGAVLISGKSASEVAVGNLYMLTQRLGYTITDILNGTE
jgi:hypothetical protein